MVSIGRRRFLLASAAGGGALLAGCGTSGPLPSSPVIVQTSVALGSRVSISVEHPDRRQAKRAIEAGFAELERIEQIMSIYRPDSQVSRLNAERVLHDPDPSLVQVLQAAARMSEASAGAFDVTVQPLWTLFAQARQEGRLPSAAEVEQARKLVGWQQVEVREDRVRLRGAGTAITLNGIAQGFAADQVLRTLNQHNLQRVLVDTGELGCSGHQSPWTIGIQHPREESAYHSLVELDARCLATSGDYATPFSKDLAHHHLFDPRSGVSPRELASVSVTAPTATEADALSTSIFVLGTADGLALIENYPQADALLVNKRGASHATPGFPTVQPT